MKIERSTDSSIKSTKVNAKLFQDEIENKTIMKPTIILKRVSDEDKIQNVTTSIKKKEQSHVTTKIDPDPPIDDRVRKRLSTTEKYRTRLQSQITVKKAFRFIETPTNQHLKRRNAPTRPITLAPTVLY